MAQNIVLPTTIHELIGRKKGPGMAKGLGEAQKTLNQIKNLQVTLMPPGTVRGGRSTIQWSDTKAVLPIPTDPRVTQIINSLNAATLTGVCNGDGTITCTLTLPNFPTQ